MLRVLRLLVLGLLVLRLLILRLVVLRILLIAARAVILWRLPSGLFLLRPRQAFGLLVREIRRLDSRRGRAEVLRAVAEILGTAHLGRFVLVAATVWGSGSCH